MAISSSPYGVQPISSGSGTVRAERMPNGIASAYGTNIFKWDPITLTAGLITKVASGTVPIFGFFAGVEYTPLGGRPAVSPFWPAGTVVDPTYDFLVYYWPAWLPDLRVKVQADGSVAQALMGSGFALNNLTAGSTSTGLSACTVAHAGVASGTQAQLAFVEFATDVGDAPGDAYTDLICTVAYPQVGFAGQTSIG